MRIGRSGSCGSCCSALQQRLQSRLGLAAGEQHLTAQPIGRGARRFHPAQQRFQRAARVGVTIQRNVTVDQMLREAGLFGKSPGQIFQQRSSLLGRREDRYTRAKLYFCSRTAMSTAFC